MSKLLPFALAGVGATATSVGGVYLIKGTSSATTPAKDESQSDRSKELLFGSVDAFKNISTIESKHHCLKDYFPGLNIKEKQASVAEITDESPINNEFFGEPDTNAAEVKGCIFINWKKTTYGTDANAKWDGIFTWLWSFKNKDRGFINFNVAETDSSDNKKLKFTGVFYVLKKEGEQWNIKHKKEVADDKRANKDELDNHFPKPHTNLNLTDRPYWGFVDNGEKLESMCRGDTCKQPAQTPITITEKLSWTKGDDDSKKLKDWSENLNWWKKLYPIGNWELESKMDKFKGSWTRQTF